MFDRHRRTFTDPERILTATQSKEGSGGMASDTFLLPCPLVLQKCFFSWDGGSRKRL